MSWNDGIQRKRFEARQKKQAEEYRKLGLTEEQIQTMYELDLEQFKSDRRYYTHTQELTSSEFDDEEDEQDDSKSALLKKYTAKMTSTIEAMTGDDISWWIEELNEQDLYRKIQLLKPKQKELLNMLIVDEMSLNEIFQKKNIPYRTLKYRLQSIRSIFKNS